MAPPATVDSMTPAQAKARKEQRIAELKRRIAEMQAELEEWEAV